MEEESWQINLINIVEIELQMAAVEQMQFVRLSDPAPIYTDENPNWLCWLPLRFCWLNLENREHIPSIRWNNIFIVSIRSNVALQISQVNLYIREREDKCRDAWFWGK